MVKRSEQHIIYEYKHSTHLIKVNEQWTKHGDVESGLRGNLTQLFHHVRITNGIWNLVGLDDEP